MKKKMDPPYKRKEKYIKVKWRVSKDNVWIMYCTVQFNYYGADGLKHTFSQGFSSTNYDTYAQCMDAACACRNKALYERQSGALAVAQSDVTVSDLWNLWEKTLPMAKGTYNLYRYIFRNYIQDPYADRPFVQITEYDIQQTLFKAAEKRNDGSVKKVKAFWKYIFRIGHMLHINYYLDFDIVQVPHSRTVKEDRTHSVSDKDLQTLCDYLLHYNGRASRCYDYALVAYALQLMRYCGLRPREVYAIRRDNVTEDGVFIKASIGRMNDNTFGIVETKTPTSRRFVPFNAQAKKAIVGVMAMSDNDYLFLRHNGQFINTSKVGGWISKISADLGIQFCSYDCRHQFATDLDLAGVSDRTRMELMGHATLITTNSYARSNDPAKLEAVKYVGNSRNQAIE